MDESKSQKDESESPPIPPGCVRPLTGPEAWVRDARAGGRAVGMGSVRARSNALLANIFPCSIHGNRSNRTDQSYGSYRRVARRMCTRPAALRHGSFSVGRG